MRRDAPENPRRFYTQADVQAIDGGFAVRLDGRVAKTPNGHRLNLPTRALAELVAAEWAAQDKQIVFAAMPATRLAFAAIEGVATAPADARAAVLRYAGGDLLCYPAQAPPSLVARQTEAWSPLLAWARDEMGLAFQTTPGLVHRPQPAETLVRLQSILDETDAFSLAGLAFGAALFGSAILALALQSGRLDGAAAFAASRVDEVFQQSRWGRDAEAAALEAVLAGEAAMLERWFRAL